MHHQGAEDVQDAAPLQPVNASRILLPATYLLDVKLVMSDAT
jgi:hypothetical protein